MVAAGLGVGEGFVAAVDFLVCFFAGDAEASGLGLGVGSAARTRGIAAKAAMTMRVMRERMVAFVIKPIAFDKVFESRTSTSTIP